MGTQAKLGWVMTDKQFQYLHLKRKRKLDCEDVLQVESRLNIPRGKLLHLSVSEREAAISSYESKERRRQAHKLRAMQRNTSSATSIWQRISDASELVGDALLNLYSRRLRLDTPPGYRLNSWARFVYSKKTYERVFVPLIADVQSEYIEALDQGQHGKAQWIRWRGRVAFWTAVFARVPVAFTAWVKTALKSAGG
jgi:hypothetical protein